MFAERRVPRGSRRHLEELLLHDRGTDEEETVPADALFVMIGAQPNSAWLPTEIARDQHGFVLTGADIPDGAGWPLERPPASLETSVPGVLAVGDLRSGSVKRVASAVGEGAIAVRLVHALLTDDLVSERQPTVPRRSVA